MARRPDLIVPIRDRREGKRILTVRNSCWFMVIVVVLFLGVTIQSDLRHTISGDYGRLFGKQVSRPVDVTSKKIDVITEAPVPDQTAADPMLVQSAVREQYLGVQSFTPQPVAQSDAMSTAPSLDAPRGSGKVIVGDGNGVAIVQGTTERRPTLSGGIFRQQ